MRDRRWHRDQFEVTEEDVLGLNPFDRRGELVGQQLDEEGEAELPQLRRGGVLVLAIGLDDLGDLGAGGDVQNLLEVRQSEVEGRGDQVRDVLVGEAGHVNIVGVDAFGEVLPERSLAREQEPRVEGHINASEGDGGNALLEVHKAESPTKSMVLTRSSDRFSTTPSSSLVRVNCRSLATCLRKERERGERGERERERKKEREKKKKS